jgi:phytoene desaturase
MSSKSALVIGSGFAGLSVATSLAAEGFQVKVLEKNTDLGGRARQWRSDGFTFDMGPSWYWMPDVFESYFEKFGRKPSDYYQLVRLDPSYSIVFGQDDFLDIPASYSDLRLLLEELEEGSGKLMDKFLKQAAYKYQVGINDLVYKPSRSLLEFANLRLLVDVLRMDVFMSFHRHVRKYFKNKKILQLVEFPILFLGALAKNTPALYSLMNYADIKLGTWYPEGGMYSVVNAMVELARENGVEFYQDTEVSELKVNRRGVITGISTNKGEFSADVVVAGADYHHVETKLLPEPFRSYSDAYWNSRVMAPSSLLFFLGLDTKIPNIRHHTLFFDESFPRHAEEIYTNPSWPSKPLFYLSAASLTDSSVAPEGGESLVILIPVATGLEDTPETREKYFDIVMDRLEKYVDRDLRSHIVVKRSYAHQDFIGDYNAFKGNAYGLANTLRQTAILKPSLKSKKVKNLYYTGQLTVPGPGVPPSLISGLVVSKEIVRDLSKQRQ